MNLSELERVEVIKGLVAVLTTIIASVGTFFGAKKIKKNNKKDEHKLSIHPLFTKIELNKNIIATYFTLENKGKEIVFKDILMNHMDIYKVNAIKLCAKIENDELIDEHELYEESCKTLNNIINDLSVYYKTSSNYTDQERKVLDIVMNKYNHWNHDRQMAMVDRIKEICNSSFYPNRQIKAITIFDTILFAMNDTVADASKTLDNLNGDLKGLKFKGVKI